MKSLPVGHASVLPMTYYDVLMTQAKKEFIKQKVPVFGFGIPQKGDEDGKANQ